jgi:geranylgeranyl pyrophosphate synthase
MANVEEFFSEVRCLLDNALDELIPTATAAPHRLHEAIRWSVFAGGKRIRPAILMAAGKTFGAATADLLRSAAAVEMIHTYSLIHDDLPAMDDDDLRRGKASCHKQFGEATAILAGDVLQTLAFKAIADDISLSAETRVRLISLLADAAGTPTGMVAGQQLDLDAEGGELSIGDIVQIHNRKTGALISAAAVGGAILGEATQIELDAIRTYAEKVGLLFQVTDDILDVTQETATLGKTAGKDQVAAKATYPGHYGLQGSHEIAKTLYREACDALLVIDKDTEILELLADQIRRRTA